MSGVDPLMSGISRSLIKLDECLLGLIPKPAQGKIGLAITAVDLTFGRAPPCEVLGGVFTGVASFITSVCLLTSISGLSTVKSTL